MRIALYFIMLVLVSSLAFALGVSPGRTTIDFKPNLHQIVEFNVLNDQHKDLRLLITVEGDLKDNVVIKDPLIRMKSGDATKMLKYEVFLPERMQKPGTRGADIVIKELPPEESEVPISIIGAVAVVTQLRVNVPYDGKYIELEEMEVQEARKDEPATFIIPVRNVGSEKLFKINAKIEILGPTNDVITVIDTNTIQLDPQRRELLKATWVANVNPGPYKAVAVVNYDGEIQKTEKIFNVGVLDVEIVSIKTKNFELGGIAKVDIAVRSAWSQKIENLYADLMIKTESGDVVTTLKTPSIDLLPQTTQDLNAFWDTEGLDEGNYHMAITLHFLDKTVTKLFVARLTPNKILFSAVSPTGEVIFDTVAGLNKTAMLGVLVVVLIIINVGWFIYFKKKKQAQ